MERKPITRNVRDKPERRNAYVVGYACQVGDVKRGSKCQPRDCGVCCKGNGSSSDSAAGRGGRTWSELMFLTPVSRHFPPDVFIGAATGFAIARFDVLRH
jgi:hypothetical protein